MAKRSRRSRRSRATKSPAPETTQQSPSARTTEAASAPSTEEIADFVQDYYYVYRDVRTLFMVMLLMIVLMFGLSYVF